MFLKKSFLILAFMSFALIAEESSPQTDNTAEKVDRVVYARIFRVPSGLFKAAFKDMNIDPIEYEIEATTKSKDTWLDIEACANNSGQYSHESERLIHNFPKYLPLRLFINEEGKLKKDGDTVIIYHINPSTKKRIKIVMTLRQLESPYSQCGTEYRDGKYHEGGFDNCLRASCYYKKLVKPHIKE